MPTVAFKNLLYITLVLVFLPLFTHGQTLININTAGSEELQTLTGIGPAKAQAIIDYRNTNSSFAKIGDIENVSGIGPATFAGIKDFITIGSGGVENTESGANQTSIKTNQTSSSQSSSSAHYSASSVTNTSQPKNITLGIGRDRVAAVGSPLEFKVETNATYNRNNIFVWNLGDGSIRGGDMISHTYEYPGEYVVVINASFPDSELVARVNVKIVEPELIITLASPEKIEVSNNSTYEVNLFGRAMVSGGKIFQFPRDTILRAGQKISFSSKMTGLQPVSTYNVVIIVIGENLGQSNIATLAEEQRLKQVASLYTELSGLQQKLALISEESIRQEIPASVAIVTEEQLGQEIALVEEEVADDELYDRVVDMPNEIEEKEEETLTASATTGAESSGFWSWLRKIKDFFLKTGK